MTSTPPARATPIRVVLADDHPVVRRGLSALLKTLDGVEVVGQAGTGVDTVKEVALSRPDVVIMDLRMPDLDGVGAT
jgi:DNA-binding NarL/FixJ family response regulator